MPDMGTAAETHLVIMSQARIQKNDNGIRSRVRALLAARPVNWIASGSCDLTQMTIFAALRRPRGAQAWS